MEINDALQEMHKKIKKAGKAPVLFVGSGISRRYYNTPDWRTLLKKVAEKVGVLNEQIEKWGSNEEIATELEYHCFAKNKPDYADGENRRYPLRKIIAQIIGEQEPIQDFEKKKELNELGKIIPTAIITTNYDKLLEKTFGNLCDVCVGQDIIFSDRNSQRKTIYKIHGSISNPESIVITQEDYDRFMETSKYLYAKLMTLFWENPIVFMGYSISDENVKNVLDTMLEVMTDEQKHDFEQRIWVLDYVTEDAQETFGEMELCTGRNTAKINKFCLKKSYGEFYQALSRVSREIQENDLMFTISNNAINLLIEPLYQYQDKFKVVVRELLQNAIDACKKGGKSINVRINVIVEKDENIVKLEVCDCGIGMDLDDIKNYFLTIGNSSKKESDLTGKFGIGILSVFLIGREARVYTKKESAMPVGIRIFENDNEKKVERIDEYKKEYQSESGTIIEVIIEDEHIVANLKNETQMDKILVSLGLDNYCVWDDSNISIYFDKTNEKKTLDKFDVNKMNKEKEDLYIDQIYSEGNRQNHKNGIALINDMITKVTFGRDYKIKNADIPFFAVKTKEKWQDDICPNLSRSEVEICGGLKMDIVSAIYKQEAEKLISEIKKQTNTGKSSALILRDEVISNCRLLKNQKIIYEGNAIVIPKTYLEYFRVYGSKKIFEKMVGIEKSDYCGYTITKSELGNMISGGQAIGVGVKFLNRYIYYATGSYNGFRMQVIRDLFNVLEIPNVPYDDATRMWANIQQNKTIYKEKYEDAAENGILWLDNSFNRNPLQLGAEIFDDVIIAKDSKEGVDGCFIQILEQMLSTENKKEKYVDDNMIKLW